MISGQIVSIDRVTEKQTDGHGSKRVSVLLKHHRDGTMFGIFRRHQCVDGIRSILGCQTLTLRIFLCFVSDVTFNDLRVLD